MKRIFGLFAASAFWQERLANGRQANEENNILRREMAFMKPILHRRSKVTISPRIDTEVPLRFLCADFALRCHPCGKIRSMISRRSALSLAGVPLLVSGTQRAAGAQITTRSKSSFAIPEKYLLEEPNIPSYWV